MDNTSLFRHMSSLYTQGRDLFYNYKQLTPTKHGSTFDTMQYAWKNKAHTYKVFGLFDTGRKDYGVQMLRSPRHAFNLIAGANKFHETRQKLATRMRKSVPRNSQ